MVDTGLDPQGPARYYIAYRVEWEREQRRKQQEQQKRDNNQDLGGMIDNGS